MLHYNHKKITNRKRKFPLIRLVIFFTAAFYIVSIKLPDKSNPKIQNATLIPSFNNHDFIESSPDFPLISSIIRNSYIVKPGDTFYGILSQFNISRQIANKIFQSLQSLKLHALFPGDSLILKENINGKINNISLLSKKRYWYSVSFSDSSITAQKKPVEVHKYIYLINGTLESSLSEAMTDNGVSHLITSKFVDIFAWDINFFLDPRKGDRFQIIFERNYADGFYNGYGEILAARYYSGNKQFSAFGLRDSSGSMRYFDEYGKSIQKQFLKAPLNFSRISSGFSYNRKHPILGIVRPHLGIDYAAPKGTPVQAAADGKILFAGRKSDYGNLIIISHGGIYQTYYGHLSSIKPNIKIGTEILQGSVIGTVGATGLATGPHLDYRMKHITKFVNPSVVNLPSGKEVTNSDRPVFSELKQYCLNNFNYRFSSIDGLYILEIKPPISEDTSMEQIFTLYQEK